MHPPPIQNDENRPPSSSSSSKMFSQLPRMYTQSSPFSFQHQNFYTPSKPSPLSSSPLSANRSPLQERENGNYSFTMSSPPPPTTNIFSAQIYGQSSQSAKSQSKRVVKKNPLIHRDEKDGERETRRKLFLKRVREDSEDKRWDKKGGDDELLRSIYLSDHKRNIGKNLREDRAYDEIPEDYEINTPQVFSQAQSNHAPIQHASISQPSISQPIPKSLEEKMADEVARQEEAELQAYLEMMEAEEDNAQQEQINEPSQQDQKQQPSQYSQHSYSVPHVQTSASDEIDYDKMFDDMNMDTGIPDDEDMMDMS